MPDGIVSTGWPAVAHKCADLGLSFRSWQVPVGQIILAKRADEKYAATIGGACLSIPRQVGKTFLVGAIVFALCLLCPGLTVIWTAHHSRTADETFAKMLAMSRRRKIAPYMLRPSLGSGEQAIRFRNGSRILFGARERGFGRGFDEVDVLIFDEAQKLTDNALDDMVPATNQSRQRSGALLLYMGTPPKPTDAGETFRAKRTEALTGEDGDTAWVEFGADPDYRPPPPPAPLSDADWRQVGKANPSYPGDTPRESILRMRKQLGPDSYLREGLGIWDDLPPADRAIDPARWVKCASLPAELTGRPTFALDVGLDRGRAWLGLGMPRADARVQLEVLDSQPGTSWAVTKLADLCREYGSPVVLDGAGPAASLIPDLEAAGVSVLPLSRAEVAQACGAFLDAVNEQTIAHLDDPVLNTAVEAARLRKGESTVWTRKGGVDIAPLYSVTLARWVAAQVVDVTQAVW